MSAGLVLTVAVALVGWYSWQSRPQGTAALFPEEGEVTVIRGGGTHSLSPPQVLELGPADQLLTSTTSRALLVLSPRTTMNLGSDTAVILRRLTSSEVGGSVVQLEVARGDTSHELLEIAGVQDQYEVLTSGARVLLSAGRYRIKVSVAETVVEVSEGVAKVVACDTWVEVWPGQYTSIVPGRAPSVPLARGARYLSVSERAGNPDIWLVNEAGEEIQLTHHLAPDLFPVWSPDGTRVAFESLRDGNGEIYVMDADGSNQANLTRNPADDHAPAWSPDGGLIAFESLRDGTGEIYVMNADGEEQVRLTFGPGIGLAPHWEAGGAEIIFSRIEGDTNRDGMVDASDMAAFFAVEAGGGIPQAFWETRYIFDQMVFPWARRGVG